MFLLPLGCRRNHSSQNSTFERQRPDKNDFLVLKKNYSAGSGADVQEHPVWGTVRGRHDLVGQRQVPDIENLGLQVKLGKNREMTLQIGPVNCCRNEACLRGAAVDINEVDASVTRRTVSVDDTNPYAAALRGVQRGEDGEKSS